MAKKEVSWLLVLLMSILFGALGVDRFILGKVGTGVLKLLITVVTLGMGGWIWWLIDIILIAQRYPFKNIKWVD
ncbi:TM2 domain-containing protein [Candidatus Woesearchaeota archaeon]|nr:TM2 domain-containing protein [Candidatus Woesearchaeota archaeon]